MNSTQETTHYTVETVFRDMLSGVIVFLVALPLCLGIAIASGASAMSGLIAGIVGGIVIGIISGSHTSVSGPAAGLTAIVAAQISGIGSFEGFLLAVVLAGAIQVILGLVKAGALSAFFPSSVIKGLLAAIGIILILKQVPILMGHMKDLEAIPFAHVVDADEVRDMLPREIHGESGSEHTAEHDHYPGQMLVQFVTAMRETLFFQGGLQWGPIVIGVFSLLFLLGWDRVKALKTSLVPAPLLVVLAGVGLYWVFNLIIGERWALHEGQLVKVPVPDSLSDFFKAIVFPDFSQWNNTAVYVGAITIAVVASLETLLNLDAVDKIDKKQRFSPPNRELFAQGVGNMAAGLLGGIPVTSVIIRGSVNVNAGSQTKLSAVFHGFLLFFCVLLIPQLLNMIPLSCLAAILILTGYKLANPALFKSMWNDGRYQFLPFIITVILIIMTDLLVGVLLGLMISLLFILHGSLKKPIRQIHERHIEGDLLHIELPNQVSFLNRASLEQALRAAPRNSRILIDGRRTNYVDPDITALINDFTRATAPVYNIQVTTVGLDNVSSSWQYESIDFKAQESRESLTPEKVLNILQEGNKRYLEGHPLDRDLRASISNSKKETRAIAAIFTGIDSLTPAELIFDLDLGEAFVIRTPGNVIGDRPLGGMEYAVSVAGAKLILIMGHADSSMLTLAIQNHFSNNDELSVEGCEKLKSVVARIDQALQEVVQEDGYVEYHHLPAVEKQVFRRRVAEKHIKRTIGEIIQQSQILRQKTELGKLGIVGGMFDPETGRVAFLKDSAEGLPVYAEALLDA